VRVLLRRLVPGETLPEINDLIEVETMLAERVDEWTEKWKREGKLEGKREGKREGKLEGKREGKREGLLEGKTDALKHLLRRRFGELPPWAQARIESATLDQLDAWLDGIFAAETLETLVGGQPPEPGPPAG